MFNWQEFNPYVHKISERQKEQLLIYMRFLQEENKKYNLTTIVEDLDIFYRHFLDSILFSQQLKISNQKILDIGTGAGFPGVVIKIFFPETQVYLVESNSKKINFLNMLIEKLNLKNIYAINQRAENFSVMHKEQFDIVISRAMAPLNILLEVGVQAVKVNGHFVCLKSKNISCEIENLNGKEANIALKLVEKQSVYLEKVGERINLFFEKMKTTNPTYPRMYSQIKKKPLGE